MSSRDEVKGFNLLNEIHLEYPEPAIQLLNKLGLGSHAFEAVVTCTGVVPS
jgi:hypothetical protein